MIFFGKCRIVKFIKTLINQIGQLFLIDNKAPHICTSNFTTIIYFCPFLRCFLQSVLQWPTDDDDNSDLGVTNVKNLNDRISGIEIPSGIVKFGNVITCAATVTCEGTDDDDILYGGIKALVLA